MENEIIVNWVTYIKKEDNQKKQSKRSDGTRFMDTNGDILQDGNDATEKEKPFVFPTEAEAIKARDKQLAIYRIKEYCNEKRGEFVPDWNNHQQRKYFISCDHQDNQYWVMDYAISQFINIFYLEKKEHCNEIIEKFKDNLDILFDKKWSKDIIIRNHDLK